MTKMRIVSVCTFLAAGVFLASVAGTASAQEKKAPDPAQMARGAKAWAQACKNCHNLRDPKELTDKNWDVTVNHMWLRAMLPGQVARDIKVFLKASN